MALGWRGQYYRYQGFFLNIVDLYKKRQDLRMFTEVILSLTTIIIFLVFALKPTVLTIINLVQEIQSKKDTIAQLDQKIAALQSAQSVYSQQSSFISTAASSVPSDPQPEIFVRQVEGISSKDSVNILGISVGQVTLTGTETQKAKLSDLKPVSSKAKEMAISISVSGNFSNLTSFINDLDNLRRPIKIDVLGINSSLTDKGRVIVAVISGRVPFSGH